jgi:hypothetical protein
MARPFPISNPDIDACLRKIRARRRLVGPIPYLKP